MGLIVTYLQDATVRDIGHIFTCLMAGYIGIGEGEGIASSMPTVTFCKIVNDHAIVDARLGSDSNRFSDMFARALGAI